MRVGRNNRARVILALGFVIAIGFFRSSSVERPDLASESGFGRATSSARLISVQQLPEGEMCPMGEDPASASSYLMASQQLPDGGMPAWEENLADANPNLVTSLHQGWFPSFLIALLQQGNLFAALQQGTPVASPSGARAERVLTPLRTLRDLHPTYSAIAVDLNSSEVVLQDNNLWSYRVFDRLDNTPPGIEETRPKRVVQGSNTQLQFNNGLYVDPKSGDIYSVESDTGDKMVVFPREANGNVAPKRILTTPHRVYNIAVDGVKQELFVTVEYPPEIVVYRKEASGNEQPLRRIQGENTGLEAPHGIVVDEKNRLLYVNNWGHHSNFRVPGTGRFNPPSIKVYSLDTSGDTPPLRVIQGDKTQLNWPAAMKLNPETGELYVANDIGQSILVFKDVATTQGSVGPIRVLKGPKTRLRYPTGVFLDTKNNELWVSNLGNASATAYPLMANGDVPPLRIIRSAPEGKKSLNFGRTAAVAYDSKREQLLVPN